MAKKSAGILAYRMHAKQLQVLLVHPGGPLWKNKDEGSWSVPKGEYETGEDPLTVAIREFEEETGNAIDATRALVLAPVKLKSGKVISAWAIEANFDQCFISSNLFEMEWPPRSGKKKSFPEIDKASWFTVAEAIVKLNAAQQSFIVELQQILSHT